MKSTSLILTQVVKLKPQEIAFTVLKDEIMAHVDMPKKSIFQVIVVAILFLRRSSARWSKLSRQKCGEIGI